MLVVTVDANFLPEKLGEGLAACRIARNASVIEPGCTRYDFFQNPDDTAKIVLIEEWASQENLDFHHQQAGFKKFIADLPNFLQGPPTVKVFEATLLG